MRSSYARPGRIGGDLSGSEVSCCWEDHRTALAGRFEERTHIKVGDRGARAGYHRTIGTIDHRGPLSTD